jgi:hypothetical protein
MYSTLVREPAWCHCHRQAGLPQASEGLEGDSGNLVAEFSHRSKAFPPRYMVGDEPSHFGTLAERYLALGDGVRLGGVLGVRELGRLSVTPILLVRAGRLELPRPYGQQILSLPRLPFRHARRAAGL